MRRRTMHGREAIAVVLLLPLLLVGCSEPGGSPTGSGEPSESPLGSTSPGQPSTSMSETTAPANPVVNGRIQQLQKYLARAHPACNCEELAFDQNAGMLLVHSSRHGNRERLIVLGPDGPLAGLPCPGDIACPRGEVGWANQTFGPQADELSLWGPDYGSADREVQVLGFDGTVRRTIDLSTVVDLRARPDVLELDWSPDGTRLAVATYEVDGRGMERTWSSHIWVVDRDGGAPRRVYTATHHHRTGNPLGPGSIWGAVWSPDGNTLGFIEERLDPRAPDPGAVSIRAVSLPVPEPGLEGPGTVRTLYEYAGSSAWTYAGSAFLWSPDGTRVAVRVPGRVLELSAEDGNVLAKHPFLKGLLIWPARRP